MSLVTIGGNLETMPMASTAGQFVTELFPHDGGRQVTVYVPLLPATAIVFAADGGWHIARLSAALAAADVRSTMIVGVHGRATDDARLQEYSPALAPARFAAHEQFFLEDVRHWASARFGLALPAARTAVWGASFGGELALALGTRHPDSYGVVFCASPGRGYRPPAVLRAPLPRVYLVAGTQEPFFRTNATHWAVALRAAGAGVILTERAGTHGAAFWSGEFPLMVARAFGG